jgi:hypothetical protein
MLGVLPGVVATDGGFEAVYVTEDGAECWVSLGFLHPSPKKASSDETTTRPAVSRGLANPEVRTWPVARRNET